MSENVAINKSWHARCKDCEAAARSKRSGNNAAFSYTADAAELALERGGSRSDRCPDCRERHKRAIAAYPVAYVDVTTLGEVADPQNPRGPLGGLGTLPLKHSRWNEPVDYSNEQFGMTNDDITGMLAELKASERRIAVVKAGTGTGKSTFMPFRLMNPPEGAAIKLRRRGPIIVTQPRIMAARGISQFVGERLCLGHDPKCEGEHYGPGYAVGNQANGKKFYDDSCGLIYVTEATLVNWIGQGRLSRYSAIIIDEAHERSEHIDLLMALLKAKLPLYPHLYLFVTSATLDKDFFVGYFGGPKKVHFVEVEPRKQVGYGVPLFPGQKLSAEEAEALIVGGSMGNGDDDDRFPGWPADKINGEDLRKTTRALLDLRPTQGVSDGDMPSAVAAQALRLLKHTKIGDILAFLPTVRQTEAAVEGIESGLPQKLRKNTQVKALASGVDEDVKQWATAAFTDGIRRVIVATTIAETSLTIKGIRYVIDSGTVNKPRWSPELLQETTSVAPHSRSGVRQRWGRVGRDAPGWVFPLYTREEYRDFPRNTAPDVTRGNLEQFRLRLIAAGIDDLNDVDLPARYLPNSGDLERQADRAAFDTEWQRSGGALVSDGAVTRDGFLTPFGRELSGFSDVNLARAIALADRLTCAPEAAVALSLLRDVRLVDSGGLLRYDEAWPVSWRVRARQAHQALALGCEDDLDLVLRVFADWQQADEPDRWARTWWINPGALLTASTHAQKLLATLAPKMSKEAARPIKVELAGRTRAAIAVAYASLTYQAGEGDSWKSSREPTNRYFSDERQLTRPSGEVVALRRKPLGAGVAIGGLISRPDWLGAGKQDEFALLLRVSERENDQDQAAEAALAATRREWPIGTLLVATFGRAVAGTDEPDFRRWQAPPLLADDLPNLEDPGYRFDAAQAAQKHYFRRELDQAPGARRTSVMSEDGRFEVANDELFDRVLSVEAEEPELDPGFVGTMLATGAKAPVDVRVRYELAAGEDAVRGGRHQLPATVIGYQPSSKYVTLVLSYAAVHEGDPAEHGDLALGGEIAVVAGPTTADCKGRYQYLTRSDGHGYFLISRPYESNGGRQGEPDFGTASPGVRQTATVVPGLGAKEAVAVTLAPMASKLYLPLGSSKMRVKGTLLEGSGSELRIKLVPAPGLLSGPTLMRKDRKQLRGSKLSDGAELEVQLERGWSLLAVDFDQLKVVQALSENHAGLEFSAEKGLRIRHTATVAALHEVAALYKGDRSWERKVWDAWTRSWTLRIVWAKPVAAQPAPQTTTAKKQNPPRTRPTSDAEGLTRPSRPPRGPGASSSAQAQTPAAARAGVDPWSTWSSRPPGATGDSRAPGSERAWEPRPPQPRQNEPRVVPGRRASDPPHSSNRHRSRKRLAVWIALALVAVLAVYLALVGTGVVPDPRYAGEAEYDQARAFDSMLDVGVSARSAMRDAVSQVEQCGDVRSAEVKMRQELSVHQSQQVQLDALRFDALPKGDELAASARKAVAGSIDADKRFIAWAEKVQAEGCDVKTVKGVSYKKAFDATTQAGEAKSNLLQLWSPSVQKYGFEARDSSTL